MPVLEEALRSERPYQRKAGLLVLAVLSDGAGDHIRQRCLFLCLRGQAGHGEDHCTAHDGPSLSRLLELNYGEHFPSQVLWIKR